MSIPIQKTQQSNYGRLALALSLGGTALAVLISIAARSLGHPSDQQAYFLFVAFQVAALAVGWRFRQEHLGRAGVVTAVIQLVLSVGLIP